MKNDIGDVTVNTLTKTVKVFVLHVDTHACTDGNTEVEDVK